MDGNAMNDVPEAMTKELAASIEEFVKLRKWANDLKDKPTKTLWFRNLVMGLAHSVVTQQRYLAIGYRDSPLLLAWACRNLLELVVITRYCLMSPQNSLDFMDDIWIDSTEFTQSFKKLLQHVKGGRQTPALDEFIRQGHAQKTKAGITRKKHLNVRDLAKAVGMEVHYQTMNEMTSKLVHPTALSLLVFEQEGALGILMPHMLASANDYALTVFKTLKAHVDAKGMEP
jgi:hypothetical protein